MIPREAARISYGVTLHDAGMVWIDEARITASGRKEERMPVNLPGSPYDRWKLRYVLAAPTNLDIDATVALGEMLRVEPGSNDTATP